MADSNTPCSCQETLTEPPLITIPRAEIKALCSPITVSFRQAAAGKGKHI